MPLRLREHVPIKQGLRHDYIGEAGVLIGLREHVPIKQGLRLHTNNIQKNLNNSESMFQ